MAHTPTALRLLLLLLALPLLIACGGSGSETDTGTDVDSLAQNETDGPSRSGPRTGPDSTPADSAAADSVFSDFDEDLGPFDIDLNGDGVLDGHIEEYEEKITELRLPDRTQATKDYNPAPAENEFVQVDQDAKPLNLDVVHAAIQYPKEVIADGKEGTVRMKILIDVDGWYAQHVLRGSPDRRLTNAVLEQVKKVRYKPAMKDGKPIKVWVNFAHTFKLPKQ